MTQPQRTDTGTLVYQTYSYSDYKEIINEYGGNNETEPYEAMHEEKEFGVYTAKELEWIQLHLKPVVVTVHYHSGRETELILSEEDAMVLDRAKNAQSGDSWTNILVRDMLSLEGEDHDRLFRIDVSQVAFIERPIPPLTIHA